MAGNKNKQSKTSDDKKKTSKTNEQKITTIKTLIGDDVQLKFEVLKELIDDIQHEYNDCGATAMEPKLVKNNEDKLSSGRDNEFTEELQLAMAISAADEEERKKKEEEEEKKQQMNMPDFNIIIRETAKITTETMMEEIKKLFIDKNLFKNENKQKNEDEIKKKNEERKKDEEMRKTKEATELQRMKEENEKKQIEIKEKKMREAEERKRQEEAEIKEALEEKERQIQEKIKNFRKEVASKISLSLYLIKLNSKSLKEIEMLIHYYDDAKSYYNFRDLDELLETIDFENRETSYDVNEVSKLVLKTVEIFQAQNIMIPLYFFQFFDPLIVKIKEACNNKPIIVIDQDKRPPLDESFIGSFLKDFLKYFCPIQVLGDGNCLWHSISVNLFGDRSMTESLRLLTAATLAQHNNLFEKILFDQKVRFNYKHEMTFNELVIAALTPGVWGDEFHILALSVALRKPIYSYGSFMTPFIIQHVGFDAEYTKIKIFCENNNVQTHFRYVGYEVDEAADPICIFYDGSFHYSPVVPVLSVFVDGTPYKEQPIKPKTQLLDYLFKVKKF